ncbi:MAG: hypothetical protein WEE64_12325 [Dehalococcoidia bacterium]
MNTDETQIRDGLDGPTFGPKERHHGAQAAVEVVSTWPGMMETIEIRPVLG